MSEKSVEVILITGRTIDQGVAMEGGKLTPAYVKACAMCYIDPSDMKKIGVITGDTILVKTNFGQIAVRAVKSEDAPHAGIAFMPYGPWANQVTSPNTDGIGMPTFRGIKATLELAQGMKIMDVPTLVRTAFRKT